MREKNSETFEQFYQSELVPALRPLEERRKGVVQKVMIACGAVIVADFNKHFHGRTYILPDTAEKMFGRFGQKLQGIGKSHGELVKMEDPVFEREFAVYSSDQVEARYILSPALMRRMLELRRKAGDNVYFSFCGGNVNIAISSDKDRFEPKLFSTVRDIGLAREFVDDLQSTEDIVIQFNK
ncbi:MAG: DUF3137 domain-containing protein [Pontiellaceae bacterium]|nr:DUF3137 domain-containing protein [Pontiellaceae bacterium]